MSETGAEFSVALFTNQYDSHPELAPSLPDWADLMGDYRDAEYGSRVDNAVLKRLTKEQNAGEAVDPRLLESFTRAVVEKDDILQRATDRLTVRMPAEAERLWNASVEIEKQINYDEVFDKISTGKCVTATPLFGLEIMRGLLSKDPETFDIEDIERARWYEKKLQEELAQYTPPTTPNQTGRTIPENPDLELFRSSRKRDMAYRSYPMSDDYNKLRDLLRDIDFRTTDSPRTGKNKTLLGEFADEAFLGYFDRRRTALPVWHQPIDRIVDHELVRSRQNMGTIVVADCVKLEQRPDLGRTLWRLNTEINTVLPPLISNHIGRIVIEPIAQDADYPIGGLHSYDDTTGASLIQIESSAVMPDRTIKQAEYSTRSVFYHEAGHVLHNVLPDSFLKMWEDVREDDPTHVSSYVRYKYRFARHLAPREDFAETHGMFITRPLDLQLLSPPRFAAMETFYSTIHPQMEDFTAMQSSAIGARDAELSDYGITRATFREKLKEYIAKEAQELRDNALTRRKRRQA